MLTVLRFSKIWFGLSGLLVGGALVLLFTWGLEPGIDFRGGALLELEFPRAISVPELSQALMARGLKVAVVQPINDQRVIIKTEILDEAKTELLNKTLQEEFGDFRELRFESIGPTISRELIRKSYWQIILVCLGILFYIAYAFRRISKDTKRTEISPWRLGLAAVIALFHDLLITVGFFVLLGHFRGVEIDSLFVTALLTILGFSVHDTIVVFDRIRENAQKFPYKSFGTIIDHAIASTLARSINTSSTLVFVLLAMLLFGGQTVFYFVLALLIGVLVGTYSSIFIASPLLRIWAKAK